MGVWVSGRKILRSVVVAGVLAVVVAGCTSVYRNHGYMPIEEDLAKIRLGVDTRESVVEAIGSPGASGVLNEGGFYYVATTFRHSGVREPRPVSRELLAISFDARGIARNIERYGLEDGRVIPLERRVTDSGASNSTFIRQLLGNLGRIGPGGLANERF